MTVRSGAVSPHEHNQNVGTGDSTVDTPALQWAVNTGRDVFLRPGTEYRVDSTITFPVDRPCRVDGMDATVRSTGNYGPMFSAVYPEFGIGLLEVERIRIRSTGKAAGQTVFSLENASQASIRRLRINDVGTAFEMANSGEGFSEHNEFDDIQISAAQTGMRFSTANKRSFKGQVVRHMRFSNVTTGFRQEDETSLYGSSFRDCQFWVNINTDPDAVFFDLHGLVYGVRIDSECENIGGGAVTPTVIRLGPTAQFAEQMTVEMVVTNSGWGLLDRQSPHPANQHGQPRCRFVTGGTGADRVIQNMGWSAPTRAFVGGTAYTLNPSDCDSVVEINSSTAATVTIPADASAYFPVGARLSVYQYGAGAVSVVGAAGVTVLSPLAPVTTAARYAKLDLFKRFDDQWVVTA